MDIFGELNGTVDLYLLVGGADGGGLLECLGCIEGTLYFLVVHLVEHMVAELERANHAVGAAGVHVSHRAPIPDVLLE